MRIGAHTYLNLQHIWDRSAEVFVVLLKGKHLFDKWPVILHRKSNDMKGVSHKIKHGSQEKHAAF